MAVANYHKIPIISPGLIFVQKAFMVSLFSGELISEGHIVGGNFAFQNGLGLTIKTAQNTKPKTAFKKLIVANSPWPYIWEGLLAYYRNDVCV